jgi:hypothetical protein
MIIIIFFLIGAILFKKLFTRQNVLINKVYVKNTSSPVIKSKVASQIHELKRRSNVLIKRLKEDSTHLNKPHVKRLVSKWNGNIEELNEIDVKTNTAIFAYNVNKGEKISICIQTNEGGINPINESMFVLLHEMAHIMTLEYAHDKEFWDNFSFLIKFASDHNLYHIENYRQSPKAFCNDSIKSSPLF